LPTIFNENRISEAKHTEISKSNYPAMLGLMNANSEGHQQNGDALLKLVRLTEIGFPDE